MQRKRQDKLFVPIQLVHTRRVVFDLGGIDDDLPPHTVHYSLIKENSLNQLLQINFRSFRGMKWTWQVEDDRMASPRLFMLRWWQDIIV